MSEVRPEQDSNRKEKAKKKKGGLWTEGKSHGCVFALVFSFGPPCSCDQGMLHMVAFNFK